MYGRHQVALAELTQSALADTDLSSLMRQAVTLVANTLAVAYSAIWELNPTRAILALRCGIGWPNADVDAPIIEVALRSPIGSAVLGSVPVSVVDWRSETRFSPPPRMRERGVISSLAVGIPGQSCPFGSLSVDVTAIRMFSDEDTHFLQSVANVLALAITRARSNQMFEQRIAERTREVEQNLIAAHDNAVLEERNRLARDLHDSVTQALYGITLHAQAARRLLAANDVATAAESLGVLHATAQEVLDEMRLLIFDLRPPILEQSGLAAALQARLEAVEGRANLHTQLIVDELSQLSPQVEQAFYRIAQEALNNALKHAQAQHITVHLRQAQSQVMLEITDDGVGFEPTMASETGGMGLRGIAERVAQLNGRLTLRSASAAGTQLRVEITL